MNILFLDDDDARHRTFDNSIAKLGINADIAHVSNADQAIKALKRNKYDLVFLDHDLGGEIYVDVNHRNTGSEVARVIYNNNLQPSAIIIIHSLNPVGAINMQKTIGRGYVVPRAWFYNELKEIFNGIHGNTKSL